MNYTLLQLLDALVKQDGSDLHISANSPPRFRIDGKLHPLNTGSISPQDSSELCYSVLNEEQKKILESEREIDFSFSIQNTGRFSC